MKKLIGIFIVTLLIGTALTSVGMNNKSINEETKSIENIQDDCNCNIDYIDPFFPGERPEISDFDYVTPEITINKNLPNSFSWKDYEGEDFTTPVNDQLHPFPCGICFLHAAVGALESVIKIREGCANLNSDLSEQYVLSCLSNLYCKGGGFGYWAFQYINDTSEKGNYCNGIIPEFCFPFIGVDKNGDSWFDSGYPPVLCEQKDENWEDFLIPIADYDHFWLRTLDEEEVHDTIKTLIMEKGPLDVGIAHTWDWHKWGWAHNEPDDYYPYPGPINVAINHEVVLLGWKDDPSIGNGGYWICKNSYGTEWGYNGFFNIEYGTNLIDSHKYNDVSWVEYDEESFNNWIPTITIDGPYYGSVGEIIAFDASESVDHEGEIISYDWDFGDDTTGTGSTPTHAYSEQGTYLVTLIVTDDSGNNANDTTWTFIDRTNSAPEIPTIVGETNGKNETLYNYSFLSSDPDGDEVYYFVFWGGFVWADYGPFTSGEEIIKSWMWVINGTFVIYAKVRDVYGAESDWAILEVTMSKNKIKYQFDTIFERFLHRFPLFEKILNQIL